MKNSNPLISIIVPVYNVEKYLHRCLDSIIHQTYKKLEIILIDDGSTDSSGNICDEYKKHDQRIAVMHQKNRGVSIARNYGIRISKGEYISFVDADDYLSNNYIEALLSTIQKYKSMVAESKLCFVKKTINHYEKHNVNEKLIKWDEYLYKRNVGSILNRLYKKELFNEIIFPPNKKYGEDYSIFYQILYKANLIAITNVSAYFYYQRRESAVQNKSPRLFLEIFEAQYNCMLFIIAHSMNTKTINKRFLYFWDRYYETRLYLKSKNDLNKIKNQYATVVNKYRGKLSFSNRMRIRLPIILFAFRKIIKTLYHLFKGLFRII